MNAHKKRFRRTKLLVLLLVFCGLFFVGAGAAVVGVPLYLANQTSEFETKLYVILSDVLAESEATTVETRGDIFPPFPPRMYTEMMGILDVSSRKPVLTMPQRSKLDLEREVTVRAGGSVIYVVPLKGAEDVAYAKLTYGGKSYVVRYERLDVTNRLINAAKRLSGG